MDRIEGNGWINPEMVGYLRNGWINLKTVGFGFDSIQTVGYLLKNGWIKWESIDYRKWLDKSDWIKFLEFPIFIPLDRGGPEPIGHPRGTPKG